MPDGLVLNEKGDGGVLLVPQLLPQLLRPLQPPVRQTLIHCILQHLSPCFTIYNYRRLTHYQFYPQGADPHPPLREGRQVEII